MRRFVDTISMVPSIPSINYIPSICHNRCFSKRRHLRITHTEFPMKVFEVLMIFHNSCEFLLYSHSYSHQVIILIVLNNSYFNSKNTPFSHKHLQLSRNKIP